MQDLKEMLDGISKGWIRKEGHTHSDNVALDVAAKCEVACNRY